MVARKPLPQSYSPSASGFNDIPDILRPGSGRNRPQSPSSNSNSNSNRPISQDYSNFNSEEQSVWRQQGYQPQQLQPQSQQQQQRPQAPIPSILLQTATGSSTASAFSDTNPFKRKALGNDIYSASPTSMPSSMTYPAELPSTPAELPSTPQSHHSQQVQSQPPTSSFDQMRMDDQPAQNPWQPGSFDNSRINSAPPTPLPTIIDAGEAEGAAGENAWASQAQQAHAMASGGPPPITRPPIPAGINAAYGSGSGAGAANFRNSNLISFPPDEEQDSADWSDVASPSQPSASSSTVVSAAAPPRPPFAPLGSKEGDSSVYEDSHAWDDVGSKSPSEPQAVVVPLVTEATGEGWSLVDTEPVPGQLSRQSTWENFSDDEVERKERKEKKEKKNKSQAAQPGSSATAATSAQSTTSTQSGSTSQPQLPAATVADATSVSSNKAKGKAVVDSAGVNPTNTTHEPLIAFDSLPSGSQSSQQNQPLQNQSQSSARFDDSIFSAPVPAPSTSQRQDAAPNSSSSNSDFRPQLPPRSMLDIDSVPPPAHPPRSVDNSKTETYPIKLVTWFDARAAKTKNPRISPILVQNANGPCPLVALVNALTLTTPADTRSALVEALASREQVSLDLLLSNVFDELMSRRSGLDDDVNLPDIDDLYSFLKGLHTGMNVNPRYIPTPEVVTTFRRTSLTHLHPTEREEMIPGTFENTREMQLYATFSIPLIHGWLPAKVEPVYDALSRQAASYEDVQNLLFRQEELEEKLTNPHNEQGLSYDEECLYQDILEIKTFLDMSATQLTPFGLNVLSKAMIPGTFAILFRNDHFSTLYLHPDTMQLMSLVTDAGYATHDEVVWETLVDVNGEHTEYFSGDFRLVGGNPGAAPSTSASGSGNGGGSGDVKSSHGRRGRSEDQTGGPSSEIAATAEELSRHEQEDRDLALALQLQEEEEAQQHEEEARRQSRLSEQYIEQNGRRPSGVTVAGNSTAQGRRPSNAAGGGRYSSTSGQQPSQVSPRRSSAGGSSSSLLHTTNSRTSTTSAQTAASGRRPTPQHVVRPLVPPATTTTATSTTSVSAPTRIVNGRPAVHRAQDADGDAEAPPSYEHAAMQAPYHPPPGAPGSETATLAGTTSNASSTAANRRTSPNGCAPSVARPHGGLPQPSRIHNVGGMGYATPSGQAYVQPGRYGQQPGMASNRNDRECVIM